MRCLARTLIVLIAFGEGIAWGRIALTFRGLGNAFGGSGDGIGGASSGGGGLLGWTLIGIIWLFLLSPYACMAAACLNLFERSRLRAIYIYSLALLGLLTICLVGTLLAELLLATPFQTVLIFMAFGNFAAIALWIYPGIRMKE